MKLKTGLENRARNINVRFCANQLEVCIKEQRKHDLDFVQITEAEALYILEILRRHMQMCGDIECGTEGDEE